MEKAPAGITGSFSMLFLMVFGRFPEKFSFGIYFSPLKPNTICLWNSGAILHTYTSKILNNTTFLHVNHGKLSVKAVISIL